MLLNNKLTVNNNIKNNFNYKTNCIRHKK